MDLFEISSYSCSSPSPAGHPVILFSGRLVSGDGIPFASPVPASSHSPEFGVHRLLEVFAAHPTEDACLSVGASLDFARLIDHPVERRVVALQLHFLQFFTPLTDPQSKLIPLSQEIKHLCAAWASPVHLLEG